MVGHGSGDSRGGVRMAKLVEVGQSSGSPELDAASVAMIEAMRWRPAERAGQPVPVIDERAVSWQLAQ